LEPIRFSVHQNQFCYNLNSDYPNNFNYSLNKYKFICMYYISIKNIYMVHLITCKTYIYIYSFIYEMCIGNLISIKANHIVYLIILKKID